jgi:hypothetical protein
MVRFKSFIVVIKDSFTKPPILPLFRAFALFPSSR